MFECYIWFNRDAVYSKFYSSSVKVADKSDFDKVYTGLQKLLEKTKKEFSKAESVFAEVFEEEA